MPDERIKGVLAWEMFFLLEVAIAGNARREENGSSCLGMIFRLEIVIAENARLSSKLVKIQRLEDVGC